MKKAAKKSKSKGKSKSKAQAQPKPKTEQQPVAPSPVEQPKQLTLPKPPKLVIAAAVAVLLLLAGGITWALTNNEDKPEPTYTVNEAPNPLKVENSKPTDMPVNQPTPSKSTKKTTQSLQNAPAPSDKKEYCSPIEKACFVYSETIWKLTSANSGADWDAARFDDTAILKIANWESNAHIPACDPDNPPTVNIKRVTEVPKVSGTYVVVFSESVTMLQTIGGQPPVVGSMTGCGSFKSKDGTRDMSFRGSNNGTTGALRAGFSPQEIEDMMLTFYYKN